MEEDKTVNTDKEDPFSKHRDKITPAYQRAVREALLPHKKAGNSVAIWQGGKVVILQPEEIEFE